MDHVGYCGTVWPDDGVDDLRGTDMGNEVIRARLDVARQELKYWQDREREARANAQRCMVEVYGMRKEIGE